MKRPAASPLAPLGRCMLAVLLVSNIALSGCERIRDLLGNNEPAVSAQFGVFFGGQIQQRKEIAFELDARKQTHGFRILLEKPSQQIRTIRWQLSPPHPAPKPGKQSSPAVPADYKGSATLAVGQREISQVWTFHPGDPLGTWNIRVTMDQQVLIDRQFFVYDRKTRAQLNRKLDAGTAH